MRASSPGANQDAFLERATVDRACAEISGWRGHEPTPLIDLTHLATALGVEAIQYKDEGGRFGLGSFKALGGPYAIFRHLAEEVSRRLGADATAEDLTSGRFRNISEAITFACATDGNHGRAVAWGARRFHAKAVVYMHEGVSLGREDAIAAFGADTVRIPGIYEDSLRAMRADAAANGWTVVSDTAGETDYDDTQIRIMAAYGVIPEEALTEIAPESMPTHVFVQGGVGGLCAGVFMRLWQRLGKDRPVFVVVEPNRADCIYQSAVAGAPAIVPGDLDTVMACLAASEVNYPAWRLLDSCVDYFLSIPDDWAPAAMCRLAEPAVGDPPVVAGESGAAGLAGLLAVLDDSNHREAIGVDGSSRILLIGSEGATDPEIYRKIVGRTAEAVVAG